MGSYTTKPLTQEEYQLLVNTINKGYTDTKINPATGLPIVHEPNRRVAAVLIIQRHLGLRLSDVLKLKREDIISDGAGYRLDDTIEQKTKHKRHLTIDSAVKKFFDEYRDSIGIEYGPVFRISTDCVQKAVREASRFLGMRHVNSHSVRKLAGITIYNATGHDLEAAREFYGHSSIVNTGIYLRQDSQQLKEAIHNTVDIPI